LKVAWKTVCQTQELNEGGSIEIVCGQDVIAIYRHANALYAIDGVCMHQGGPLAKGKIANGTVTCPWHGWQYDLATGNNSTTCKPMLKSYEIRENNGVIEIDLPG